MYKWFGLVTAILVVLTGCGGGQEVTMEIAPEDQQVIQQQREMEQMLLQQGRQQMDNLQQPSAAQ